MYEDCVEKFNCNRYPGHCSPACYRPIGQHNEPGVNSYKCCTCFPEVVEVFPMDRIWEGPAGRDGKDGSSLEFAWEGTRLKVRVKGTEEWVYSTSLLGMQGPKGDTGEKGETGAIGPRGYTGAPGQDGDPGVDGNGVDYVELHSSSGIIKTYRMHFTDGTYFDFTVTDGINGQDGEGIVEGGTTGQVLKKKSNDDFDTEWVDYAYDDLSGRPKINNITLSGNKSLSDLGIKQTYNKSDVGLGNVDNVRQYSVNNPPPYPVTSVNGNTGTVVIDTHDDLIPTQASSSNQLADKNFVNSTVGTATATFRGTYDSLAELEQVSADENDYGFVVSTDSAGNTVYNRYKYASGTWTFEYALNNSSFTQAQWEAIQSGITDDLVTKLQGIEAGAEVNIVEGLKIGNVTQQVSSKIMQINPDTTPMQGSNNVIDSNAVYEVEKLLPTDRDSGENVDIDNAQPYKVLDIVADGKYQQGDNPSPDNPQPITQVTSATWNRTGKQLFDKTKNILQGGSFDADGTIISNAYTTDFFVQEYYIPAEKNTAYNFNSTSNPTRLVICEYDANKNFIKRNIDTANNAYSITTTSTTEFVRLCSAISVLDVLQFELGSSATPYEPYQGQTIPIDLDGNEVCAVSNTIKDKLLVDRYGNCAIKKNVNKYTITGNETTEIGGTGFSTMYNNGYIVRAFGISDLMKMPVRDNIISNCFLAEGLSLWNATKIGIQTFLNDSKVAISAPVNEIETFCGETLNVNNYVTHYLNYLVHLGTYFYYPLAIPQIIPLPKLSVLPTTLKGINHIWIDTNIGTTDIEVEYVEDLSLAIPTKMSELTNDSGYVKNTDYASSSTGGVIKAQSANGLSISNEGFASPANTSYANYLNAINTYFIGKGTLENVITGKELTNKNYVDSLTTELAQRLNILEQKEKKAYSIVRKITDNSSSAWTRADNAVNLIANANIGSLAPVRNDFDNIYPWCDIRDCNVDSEGNPTYFWGDEGFTRNEEVYVYIPKHWIIREQYNIQEDNSTNKYEKITIYDYNAPGSIEIAPYMVGKYHTSKQTINGVETHVSKTGLEPLNSTTRATFRTKAKAKGSKWGLLDWHYWDLCYLYLVEYADYNVDNTVGKGYIYGDMSTSALEETSVNRIVVSGTLPTGFYVGKTISIGTDRGNYSIARSRKITAINDYSSGGVTGKEIVFDGDAVNTTTSSKIWASPEFSGTLDSFGNKSGCLANDQRHTVVYRGIENLWGNLWQHVDGISIKNYLGYVCYDPDEYTNDKFTTPYTALGYTNSSGNDSYIKEVGYDANNPLVALPTVVGGSSSTYVCDNYWSSSGNKILHVGGDCNPYGSRFGLFASNCNLDSSISYWSYGARLLIQAS